MQSMSYAALLPFQCSIDSPFPTLTSHVALHLSALTVASALTHSRHCSASSSRSTVPAINRAQYRVTARGSLCSERILFATEPLSALTQFEPLSAHI